MPVGSTPAASVPPASTNARSNAIAFLNACCETQPLRSEEHTSELQSRPHLVCRLLLEKKKTHIHSNSSQTACGRLPTNCHRGESKSGQDSLKIAHYQYSEHLINLSILGVSVRSALILC